MEWFKAWHGTPKDSRWKAIALAVRVKTVEVVGLVRVLEDFASQHPDRGSIAGIDARDIAAEYGMKTAHVEAVITALRDRRVIVDDRLVEWDEQQKRLTKDDAALRTSRWRERKRQRAEPDSQRDNIVPFPGDGDVTVGPSPGRHGDGDVTVGDGGDGTESKREDVSANALTAHAREAEFGEWWRECPNKVGIGAAREAYAAARRKASADELLNGQRRYRDTKPPDRLWCNPTKWLNEERWLDEPASAPAAPAASDNDAAAKAALDRITRLRAEAKQGRAA